MNTNIKIYNFWKEKNKKSKFYLFLDSFFVDGMARVLDLGANLQFYSKSEAPEKADYEALFSDWKTVGNDLKIAIKQYERQAGIAK